MNHPYTLQSLYNLGKLYDTFNENDLAVESYCKALKGQKGVLQWRQQEDQEAGMCLYACSNL